MKCIILIFLVLIFILLLVKFNINKNESFTNYNPTISLCVPCFPRDKPKLEILFNSVRKQTIKPDEIIVGHSEMNNSDAKRLENKYSDLNLKVVNTEKKQYAAANRNMAASANKSDYISFMDADDIMLENKIEILKKIIAEEKPLSIVHNYNSLKTKYKISNDIKRKIYGDEIFDTLKNSKTIHINTFKVHHGHITISKDVFKNVKQNTSNKWRRGQDSKFIRDIFEFYGREKNVMVYLDIPLTIYIPS